MWKVSKAHRKGNEVTVDLVNDIDGVSFESQEYIFTDPDLEDEISPQFEDEIKDEVAAALASLNDQDQTVDVTDIFTPTP